MGLSGKVLHSLIHRLQSGECANNDLPKTRESLGFLRKIDRTLDEKPMEDEKLSTTQKCFT